MLGSQPTASLSAVLHAGITPAPYPSGALGSSRVNPTLAPSAHNPAVSGCVLLPSALGNLGVGQRRGASGSHTAVARATNVVPQDGLLPTPLLMQVIPLGRLNLALLWSSVSGAHFVLFSLYPSHFF